MYSHCKLSFQKPATYLNTALCQFTPSASKTENAIQYIKHFSLLSRLLRGEVENGVHHMNLILNNNSLIETQMWHHRLDKKTQNMNICTLSSRDDSKFNSIEQVISHFGEAESPNDLIDIIPMCTVSKRTDNAVRFIKYLEKGNNDFSKIGIKQITMTIMFDEADKNIGLIAEFLKNLSKVLTDKDGNFSNHVVRDIHFITATANAKSFWKQLEDCGITKLKNIKHLLKDAPGMIDLPHDELLKDYRQVSEHIHRAVVSDMTSNTAQYAALVLPKIFAERATRENAPLTIFAPAENEISTHNSMAALFNANNFTVLILNGERKGFLSPDGRFTSIDSFNEQHSIKGELYSTLVAWRQQNPTVDLAITGYYCVERGVTFNTVGFNFTDFILSAYHLRNEASLVQLLGRANGGKEYVQVMNIWAPKEVIDHANTVIRMLNDLHRKNPKHYKKHHFVKKTKKEVEEKAMTIPQVIQPTADEFTDSTKKVGTKYDEKKIISVIAKYNEALSKELSSLKKKQITQPKVENQKSIKKHIDDFVRAAEENRKYSIDIDKEEKEQDLYQIFLDSQHHRYIISIYKGSKLKEEDSDDDDDDEEED